MIWHAGSVVQSYYTVRSFGLSTDWLHSIVFRLASGCSYVDTFQSGEWCGSSNPGQASENNTCTFFHLPLYAYIYLHTCIHCFMKFIHKCFIRSSLNLLKKAEQLNLKVSFVTIICSQIGFDPVQSPDIFYSVNEFTWQGGGSSNPSGSSPV